MITKPTVLILGAGASMPYQFPSGKKLREKICREIKEPLKDLFDVPSKKAEVEHFISSFSRSGTSSIDAFLEYRTEFMEIGKLAIALALIPSENEGKLFF